MERRKKAGAINLLLKISKLVVKSRTFSNKLVVKVPSTRSNIAFKKIGFISTKENLILFDGYLIKLT